MDFWICLTRTDARETRALTMSHAHPLFAARVSAVLAASLGLVACGPNQVHLDPRNVTAVELKLPVAGAAGAQPTFCPGKPIRLELRAQMKDGSTCSSTDSTAVCMGQKGSLIDPGDIRVQGTNGAVTRLGADFLWVPSPDPLATAVQGTSVRAFLETIEQGKAAQSPEAKVDLRPEYSCMQENVFSPPLPSAAGQEGNAGPDLKVSVTTFATPFYPEALLVRVEQGGRRTYIVSTDRSKQVTVVSKGQSGGPGHPGVPGSNGANGRDADGRNCAPGDRGRDGADGQAGGTGGNGGPGGAIQLFIDEAAMDKVRGWIGVASIGGDPGAPGLGGPGGQGGRGGHHADVQNCQAPDGQNGKSGIRGVNGDPGRRGANGPEPTVTPSKRDAMFVDDLPLIQQIEAAAKPKS